MYCETCDSRRRRTAQEKTELLARIAESENAE